MKYTFMIGAYEDLGRWHNDDYDSIEEAKSDGLELYAKEGSPEDGDELFVGKKVPILKYVAQDALVLARDFVDNLNESADEFAAIEYDEGPIYKLADEHLRELGQIIKDFISQHNQAKPGDVIIDIERIPIHAGQ